MFGQVPAYTDISHFRAPYKNAVIGGFGAEQVPTPPPPPNGGPTVEMYVSTDDRGYRTVNKQLQPILNKTLEHYGTVFIGGAGNNVKISPYTPEQLAAAKADPAAKAFLDSMSAATWVKKQVDAGQVVFATVGTLAAVLSGASVPGSDMLGTWPAGSDQAKEAAKSPIGVVIGGDPEGAFAFAAMGPVAIALVAAGVVGAGYWFMTRKKGGGRGRAARF
jgi:hypothetical protein